METQFRVVDIAVIGVLNKNSELVNLVYKNEKGEVITCVVAPAKLEGMRELFNNLMGK